jgi:hypothetical protein
MFLLSFSLMTKFSGRGLDCGPGPLQASAGRSQNAFILQRVEAFSVRLFPHT